MRAIIHPYSTNLSWCKQFFPARSFCDLPIAGRSYGERLIDAMQLAGAEAVMLLDDHFDYGYLQRLNHVKPWSCKVKYHGAPVCSSIRNIVEHHSRFTETDETLIALGPVLPDDISPAKFEIKQLTPIEEGDAAQPGLYILKNGILYRTKVLCLAINSIREYFQLNLTLLRHPRQHLLPGYGVENGVHLGSNDIIMPGGMIRPPVMLGDSIILERDVNIAGDVIIGDNVMIARGNTLKRSIILDNTYIGPNMEFSGKIVDGNRVIDPVTGGAVEISELGVAGNLVSYGSKKDAAGCVEYLLALVLMLVQTPLWLCLYLPLRQLWNKTLWKYKLCFDCYPYFWKVLIGKGRLISIGKEHEPYVFTYRDTITNSRKNSPDEFINCYFRHKRSPWFSFKAALKACFNRIFVNHNPRARQDDFELLVKPFLNALPPPAS